MIKNKLGIERIFQLKEIEEKISKEKAISFWLNKEYELIDFTNIDSLFDIHKLLFNDLYEWAGKLREVNLSKGGFQFAKTLFLNENLRKIGLMPNNTFDEIILKYIEINILHPFREGNGRSGRLWLDCLLKQQLGVVIDWSKLDKEEYMYLMQLSVSDGLPLITELKNITTTDINNREIFFKGLDFSYYYEDQYRHSSEDIAKIIEADSIDDDIEL